MIRKYYFWLLVLAPFLVLVSCTAPACLVPRSSKPEAKIVPLPYSPTPCVPVYRDRLSGGPVAVGINKDCGRGGEWWVMVLTELPSPDRKTIRDAAAQYIHRKLGIWPSLSFLKAAPLVRGDRAFLAFVFEFLPKTD